MNETDGPVFVLRPSVSLNFCGACPFHALAAGSAGHCARDRVEHGAEAVAHGGQSANGSDRDQGSDQAIFDGGCAVFVFGKTNEVADYESHSNWLCSISSRGILRQIS